MFDPRSPYHRRRWHYDSDQPLSVAQLIAAGSLDARSAAVLWLAIQRHQSVIVSGPTDPTPGVGKTTTLNALLEFLPVGTTLVYTMGMYEDFDFIADTEPGSTCVLANEVSDHLPIYMWGRVARKLLRLPAEGYAVATSCHADTLEDVLHMLQGDLRLNADAIGKLGIVVNIGLVGRLWPPRRRVLSVNYLRCRPRDVASANEDADVVVSGGASDPLRRPSEVDALQLAVLQLAVWNPTSDRLTPAAPEELAALAQSLGMPLADFTDAVDRRTAVLEALAAGRGASIRATRHAIEELMLAESDDAPAQRLDEASSDKG